MNISVGENDLLGSPKPSTREQGHLHTSGPVPCAPCSTISPLWSHSFLCRETEAHTQARTQALLLPYLERVGFIWRVTDKAGVEANSKLGHLTSNLKSFITRARRFFLSDHLSMVLPLKISVIKKVMKKSGSDSHIKNRQKIKRNLRRKWQFYLDFDLSRLKK